MTDAGNRTGRSQAAPGLTAQEPAPPEVTAPAGAGPRFYTEFAAWWPLVDPPAHYAEEAGVYADLLEAACGGPVGALLELGSGGGNNALHLKRRCRRMVLTDLSPGMLAVSRALNPECEHRLGDMRTLRIGERFDAVFVHDAVGYMATEADLRRAIATAWAHCRPGGAALFVPDYIREHFRPDSTAGGCDEPWPPAPAAAAPGASPPDAPPAAGPATDTGSQNAGPPGAGPAEATSQDAGSPGTGPANAGAICPRGLRYLEWIWDPDPDDTQYVADYAFLLRERDGTTNVLHDRHIEGLFPRAVWLDALRETGFDARAEPLILSDVEPDRHELFVARRPA